MFVKPNMNRIKAAANMQLCKLDGRFFAHFVNLSLAVFEMHL